MPSCAVSAVDVGGTEAQAGLPVSALAQRLDDTRASRTSAGDRSQAANTFVARLVARHEQERVGVGGRAIGARATRRSAVRPPVSYAQSRVAGSPSNGTEAREAHIATCDKRTSSVSITSGTELRACLRVREIRVRVSLTGLAVENRGLLWLACRSGLTRRCHVVRWVPLTWSETPMLTRSAPAPIESLIRSSRRLRLCWPPRLRSDGDHVPAIGVSDDHQSLYRRSGFSVRLSERGEPPRLFTLLLPSLTHDRHALLRPPVPRGARGCPPDRTPVPMPRRLPDRRPASA